MKIADLLAFIRRLRKPEPARDGNHLGPTFDDCAGSVIWQPETVAMINRTIALLNAERGKQL